MNMRQNLRYFSFRMASFITSNIKANHKLFLNLTKQNIKRETEEKLNGEGKPAKRDEEVSEQGRRGREVRKRRKCLKEVK